MLKTGIDKREDPAMMMAAAGIYERQHRTDQAVALYRSILTAQPSSEAANSAQNRLGALGAQPFDPKNVPYKKAIGAAQQVYDSEAFDRAAPMLHSILDAYTEAEGDEHVTIEWLTSLYKSGDVQRVARELDRRTFQGSDSQAQALWLRAEIAKRMGRTSQYADLSKELIKQFPTSAWSAQSLNSRAKQELRQDREDEAMHIWEDLARLQARSPLSSEATYRLGRYYYSRGEYAKAADYFLQHLQNFPASDYLGSALYWTGRTKQRLEKKADALATYRHILARYPSGYYSQKAEERVRELVPTRGNVQKDTPPQDERLSRVLKSLSPIQVLHASTSGVARVHLDRAATYLKLSLNDWAIEELQAGLAVSPASHEINLALARIYATDGDHLAALTAVRRAHPDYLSYPLEALDQESWRLLFPLEEWDTITAQCRHLSLDPYLIAGLIRQESGFNLRAKSRANARGLMQVLPSTGRRVARSYGFGSMTTEKLYEPELNIRLGTQYFSRLIHQFKRVEYALAAYNGGPERVTRWLNQLRNLDVDEWVDSVPLTETRLYVQGVLRSAAQYRRIYGEEAR